MQKPMMHIANEAEIYFSLRNISRYSWKTIRRIRVVNFLRLLTHEDFRYVWLLRLSIMDSPEKLRYAAFPKSGRILRRIYNRIRSIYVFFRFYEGGWNRASHIIFGLRYFAWKMLALICSTEWFNETCPNLAFCAI